jgi:SAM-dependent methyltransferase
VATRLWIPIFFAPAAASAELASMTDRFAAIDYAALIDWDSRFAREGPFLDRALADVPARRILDLGCGPGQHARLLASKGFDVVGIDASPSMLQRAAETQTSGLSLRFVLGDLADLGGLVDGMFGAAICVGNTLPSVRTASALTRMLEGLRARLLPGGVFVLQVLNYEKIFSAGLRHLPLTLRPAPDGSLVFVRLMDLRPGGDVLFAPTVLDFRPASDPAVTLRASERVEVHGWTRPELDGLLEAAGFRSREIYGSVGYTPYVPKESADLVVLAR